MHPASTVVALAFIALFWYIERPPLLYILVLAFFSFYPPKSVGDWFAFSGATLYMYVIPEQYLD